MTSLLLPRRRARLVGVLVAASAVAVPIAGCGDSGGGGGGGSSSAQVSGTDPASLLPANAPVYVEAQVRPSGDLANNLKTVAGKILRTGDPAGKVVGWLDSSLKDEGKTYDKDVAPWLGQRAGLAVLGFGAGGGGKDDVDIAAAIASKDDDSAQKFVDSRKDTVAREYRGVKYKYDAKDDVAAAVVDHAVLVGTDKGFKSAVDAKSGAKLADAVAFKKARSVVGTGGAGFAYADPTRIFDLVAGAASSKLSQGNVQGLNMVKGMLANSGLQSIAASLNVASNALQIDAAAVGLKPSTVSAATRGDGPGAAAAVPAGSWLSLGVGDVGGAFNSALKSFGGAAAGVDPQTLLKSLKDQLGFDVQKDLLSWMGDAAIFVRGGSLDQLGGALVVTSKDPAASKASIPKLKALLEKMGVKTGALSGAGTDGATGFSVDAGSSLPAKIEVAAKDDKFVIALGQGALGDALAPSAKLGDSDPYRQAASLLGDTKPSIFLDIPQIVKLVGTVAGNDEDFQKAKPTLDAFGPAAAGLQTSGDAVHLKVAVAVP